MLPGMAVFDLLLGEEMFQRGFSGLVDAVPG